MVEWIGLGRITAWVIGIIVLIVILVSLFGPKIGLLNLAAEAADKISDLFMPTKPSEKLKPITEADIPEELRTEYDNLIYAFERGINAEAPCLLKYTLPEDFKDYKIKIESDEKLYLTIINEKGQEFKHKNFDIKTCITSGKKGNIIVAQNFYNFYIKGAVGPIYNEFNEVNNIIIENNKKLNVGKEYDITGHFLFKPNNEYVCFLTTENDWFPGSGGCSGGKEKGLDNDCLKDLPNNNIGSC